MRDLGVLKERIEFAERQMKAAHSARERESDALMAMWRQIRDRFEDQEQEIARYRSELAELTQVNDELSALVDRLIASIEGNVEASESETVPEVAGLAQELLRSEPVRGTAAPRPPAAARRTSPESDVPASRFDADALAALETDDPLDLGTPIDETDADELRSNFARMLGEHMSGNADDDGADDTADADPSQTEQDYDTVRPVDEESGSPGIRDLISRIEGAVGGKGRKRVAKPSPKKSDDDLARELAEIESLRNELSGLRDKISAGR